MRRLATGCAQPRCGIGALAFVVLLLAWPHRGHAQCVVEGTIAAADVRVDRGDGRAISIAVRATPVAITIPSRPRRPLQIDVRGPLAFSGTTMSRVLALRAGTYAGGAIEIAEDGRAPVTSARIEEGGVGVELDLGGVTVGDVIVPCGALTTIAPYTGGHRGTHESSIGVRLAARGARLELRSAPDAQAASIVVTGLHRWNAIFAALETSGTWTRVRTEWAAGAARLVGWASTRAVGAPRGAPGGVLARGASVRCGHGYGGPHDPDHALVAPGTPVSLVPGGAPWTTTSGDRSFLVRVLDDHAEILAAQGAVARRIVRGCSEVVVLGTVPTSALVRAVFAHPELRVRRADGGGLAIEQRSGGTLREDLRAGDVVIAASGVPLDAREPVYMVAHGLVSYGRELSLTVLREGTELELAQLELRGRREARPYRALSDVERALRE